MTESEQRFRVPGEGVTIATITARITTIPVVTSPSQSRKGLLLKASCSRSFLPGPPSSLPVRSFGIDLRANACRPRVASVRRTGGSNAGTHQQQRARETSASATSMARVHTYVAHARCPPLRHASYTLVCARVRATRRQASGLTRTCRDTHGLQPYECAAANATAHTRFTRTLRRMRVRYRPLARAHARCPRATTRWLSRTASGERSNPSLWIFRFFFFPLRSLFFEFQQIQTRNVSSLWDLR